MGLIKITLIICSILALGSTSNKNKNPRLVEIVKGFNEQVPLKIDDNTVIDEIILADNNTIEYYYTTSIKDSDSITIKKILKQSVIDLINQYEQYKELKDLNTSFRHMYRNDSSQIRFTVNITPDDYNNSTEKSTEEAINDVIEINMLQLPIRIDESMIFVDNKFAAPDTLVQYYEIDKEALGNADIDAHSLKKANISHLTNSQNGLFIRLKSKNVILKNIYTLSDGEVITTIITPDDYKQEIN